MTRPLAPSSVCFSLGLALVALVACGERPEPSAAGSSASAASAAPVTEGRPHVMVLVLDACRADRFGAYGFERPTSPAFDALAAESDSVLFRRHFAQAPHTRASTASFFTSVYPFQHGVFNEDDLTPELKGKDRYRGRKVADGYETLAERFAAGGYRTFGATTNPVIAGKDGYSQGFSRYEDPAQSGKNENDVELVDRAVADLAADPSPAFAYVHTTGCHSPTRPEQRDPDYFARYAAGVDEEALNRKGVDPGSRKFKWAVREGKVKLDAQGVAYVSTVYEAVLAKVDREIVARAIEGLKKAGLYDRTLLAVTADHGEELYDHGGVAHGRTVWNEVLQVPLVVKFPKGAKPAGVPAAIERVTQTIDVYPGLVRAAGLEPGAGIAGHDPFGIDGGRRESEIAFAQAPGTWSLLDWPLKVVVLEKQRRAELYDLAADPGETRDLAAERGDDLRRLVRLGEALQKALPKLGADLPEGELELDPEMIEQLRSLGYIQ